MAFFKSFCFCCVSHFLTFDWCLKKVSSVFPRQLSHSHTENLQLSFYYWCYWRVCIRVEPGWASLLYHAVRETLNRGRWQAPRTIVYLGRERERERERENNSRGRKRELRCRACHSCRNPLLLSSSGPFVLPSLPFRILIGY